MAFGKLKRLTYSCSDPQGLLVLGFRLNEAGLARLYVDDLENSGRCLLDMEKKCIIESQSDIVISANDARKIHTLITLGELPFEEKIEDAIMAHFLNS